MYVGHCHIFPMLMTEESTIVQNRTFYHVVVLRVIERRLHLIYLVSFAQKLENYFKDVSIGLERFLPTSLMALFKNTFSRQHFAISLNNR